MPSSPAVALRLVLSLEAERPSREEPLPPDDAELKSTTRAIQPTLTGDEILEELGLLD